MVLLMTRYVFLTLFVALAGCAGPGWKHEPINYSTLISKPTAPDSRVQIEIIETSDTETQRAIYTGTGFYGSRSWEYDQRAVLDRLADDTEAALNEGYDGDKVARLRISGEMRMDQRGDYTASLVGEMLGEDGVVRKLGESSGFVESKVASEVAFENAYKLAFSNLLKNLGLVQ
jgi:hypothetical protein